MKEMTIGALARAAGVNLETIRYYQRRGLIATPRKPQGGVRRYPLASLAQLHFIKRAQQLGFSLPRDTPYCRITAGGHRSAHTGSAGHAPESGASRACLPNGTGSELPDCRKSSPRFGFDHSSPPTRRDSFTAWAKNLKANRNN